MNDCPSRSAQPPARAPRDRRRHLASLAAMLLTLPLAALPTLAEVTNVACLPFPENDITAYNGDEQLDAVNTHDRTTITWKDDTGTAEAYLIER